MEKFVAISLKGFDLFLFLGLLIGDDVFLAICRLC
jgi:hypothetical protein